MNSLLPAVRAVMARRLLVNYRVRPDAIIPLLPAPFRLKLVRGWAMAGICLIRLEQMRPPRLPGWIGLASENAAHRIAVEWTENGRAHEGVFIPRRDTDSLANRMAGGRLFPGVHHPARFHCEDDGNRIEIRLESLDQETRVEVAARTSGFWPKSSIFRTLTEASEFFQRGACGWSWASQAGALEGVELQTGTWEMAPLDIERVESSFFGDPVRFPPGAAEIDCALIMRGIPHRWRQINGMRALSKPAPHHRTSAFFEMP